MNTELQVQQVGDDLSMFNWTKVAEQFCTMEANTPEEKRILFKAMNQPDKRLSECINMTLNIKDIYAEVVQITDQNTGEIINAPRIVMIDTNGIGYQCVSKGMLSSLKKLFAVYGSPTWQEGLAVTVKQIKTRDNRSVLTLDID